MATTDVMRLPSAGREGGGERFNYKGMHRYIITLPVAPGGRPFAAPEPVFAVMNTLRESALEHRFDVYAYCFLPDRLLLIMRGKDAESDMKAFLSAFRTLSGSLPDVAQPLWARKYTERVLRKTEESRTAARELLMTPVREKLVASVRDYPYLGSFTVETAAILTIPGWERKGGPGRGPAGPGGKRPGGGGRAGREGSSGGGPPRRPGGGPPHRPGSRGPGQKGGGPSRPSRPDRSGPRKPRQDR